MNKIYIYKEQNTLVCKKVLGEEVTYIKNYREFTSLIESLEDFTVKLKDTDMYLVTPKKTVILKEYYTLLEEPYFSHLKNNIQTAIEQNGFIDLTKKDKLNRKIKNTKHNNSSIKKVTLIMITLTLAVNIFTTQLNEPEKESTPVIVKNPTIHITDLESRSLDGDYDLRREYIFPADEVVPKIVKVSLDFEEYSNTEKALNTKDNYYSLIEKYSDMYGLDANLILGLATQERGEHSTTKDSGGAIGLMQVQVGVWLNEEISAYVKNEQTNLYEQKTMTITESTLKNLDSNIEVGCMIFQNCLINSNYNIPVAIQMYNMGQGSMNKILNAYASDVGLSKEEVLNNPYDLGWTEYRYLAPGDENYLENVNKWVDENVYTVTNVLDGSTVSIEFTNSNEKRM